MKLSCFTHKIKEVIFYFIQHKKESAVYVSAILFLIFLYFLPQPPKWLLIAIGIMYAGAVVLLMFATVLPTIVENIQTGKSKFKAKQAFPIFVLYLLGFGYGKCLGDDGIFLVLVGSLGSLMGGKVFHQSCTLPYIGDKPNESWDSVGLFFWLFFCPEYKR